MMKYVIIFTLISFAGHAFGQFEPSAGVAGTSAIHKDSSLYVNWATSVVSFSAGPEDISDSQSPTTVFGIPANALGIAEGTSSDIVSLGDGGQITLGFEYPIANGNGPDFAVFENSFTDDFLEFGFVEVSTNGTDFVRFSSTSYTQTAIQTSPFGNTMATLVNNLAGKYRQGYGTPFDLAELTDSAAINIDSINYIRIVDVVGSIDSTYASYDAQGNMINDPFPTPFPSSGFDLDAIGVIHQNNPLEVDNLILSVYKVFPNPAQNTVTIIGDNHPFTYSLFNNQGKVVAFGSAEQKEVLNIGDIENGLYFLRITTKEKVTTEPILIIK